MRADLRALETRTTDREELLRIALAYDLLGAPGDIGRVGARLKAEAPQDPIGGELQDYSDAVTKLTADKTAPHADLSKLRDPFGPDRFDGGSGGGRPAVRPDLPYKLPVKAGAYKAVPTLANEAPSHGSGVPPAAPIGAGALLATGGLLAWQLWGRRAVDEQVREARRNASLALIGVGALAIAGGGAGMLGAFTLPPAFSLAGGGVAGGAIAVDGAALVSGAASTAIGANAAAKGMSLATPQQSTPGQSQSKRPQSDIKKPSASDPELQRVIDKLFQPGDTEPGGTAGAVREEFYTKQPTKGHFHLQAARERINWISNVMRARNLNAVDQATAEALRADLQQAVNLYKTSPRP